MNSMHSEIQAPSWLFNKLPKNIGGVYIQKGQSEDDNQNHTNKAFSEKWNNTKQSDDEADIWKIKQLKWYLSLYGYQSEEQFAQELKKKRFVLDAGCGLGYKAAWFARLAPKSIIVAMDFSDSIYKAADRYKSYENMIFVQGDIADTEFKDEIFDFISCDQVLHHTESPPCTLQEFYRISSKQAVLNTYVYAKKALPRELLDEYFRHASKELDHSEIWQLSEQLTELGKQLSALDVSIDFPEMPALGIKGGKQDIQRFIYWNFLKCFWNEEMGWEQSVAVNFDWYSPSNAFRYDKQEFFEMCHNAGWENKFLHSEEACWSGRFQHFLRD